MVLLKCKYCNYQTNKLHNLKRHEREVNHGKVTGSRKCESCNYHTNSAYNLHRHKTLCHRDCNLCGYVAGSLARLKKHHKLKHKEPEDGHLYQCIICDKSFSYMKTLMDHYETAHKWDNNHGQHKSDDDHLNIYVTLPNTEPEEGSSCEWSVIQKNMSTQTECIIQSMKVNKSTQTVLELSANEEYIYYTDSCDEDWPETQDILEEAMINAELPTQDILEKAMINAGLPTLSNRHPGIQNYDGPLSSDETMEYVIDFDTNLDLTPYHDITCKQTVDDTERIGANTNTEAVKLIDELWAKLVPNHFKNNEYRNPSELNTPKLCTNSPLDFPDTSSCALTSIMDDTLNSDPLAANLDYPDYPLVAHLDYPASNPRAPPASVDNLHNSNPVTTSSNFWAPTPRMDDTPNVDPFVATRGVPETTSSTLTSNCDNTLNLYGILDSLLDEFP